MHLMGWTAFFGAVWLHGPDTMDNILIGTILLKLGEFDAVAERLQCRQKNDEVLNHQSTICPIAKEQVVTENKWSWIDITIEYQV